MELVLVRQGLSEQDLQKAREDYATYIKITFDIKREEVVLGGVVTEQRDYDWLATTVKMIRVYALRRPLLFCVDGFKA